MLRKAVLSFVGRALGITALVAQPLVASAAQPTTENHAKDHARARSPKKVHAHASTTHERAHEAEPKKRVRASGAEPHQGEPSVEIVVEKASTRRAPKASATPLPTIAAASTKPLAMPLDVRHAAEPTRTPIVLTERTTKKKATKACLHAPVDVTRGAESESFALTKCDGSVAPMAVEEMSILTRPGSAAKPEASIADLAKKTGDELAPGIRRMDARVLERVQLVVDHFAKDGKAPRVFVVSGYRPTSKGSFHATGRAIDFRMDGVENTDLVTFCKTLPDTGCGFYPNSAFIHLDVRDAGAGHVSWIDAATPGEKPEYVATWPVRPKTDDGDAVHILARLEELQLLPSKPAAAESSDAEDVKPPAKPATLVKKSDDVRKADEGEGEN